MTASPAAPIKSPLLAKFSNRALLDEVVARGLGDEYGDDEEVLLDARDLATARADLLVGRVDEALIHLGRALVADPPNYVFANLRDLCARHYEVRR